MIDYLIRGPARCIPRKLLATVTLTDLARTLIIVESIQSFNANGIHVSYSISLPEGLHVTPIPGGLALFLSGGAAFAMLARRRRAAGVPMQR